ELRSATPARVACQPVPSPTSRKTTSRARIHGEASACRVESGANELTAVCLMLSCADALGRLAAAAVGGSGVRIQGSRPFWPSSAEKNSAPFTNARSLGLEPYG